MARAKRTDRSEARRRYRQTTSDANGPEPDNGAETTAALDFGERRSGARPYRAPDAPSSTPRPDPNARPGFGAAFRGAYRQPNIREDLRALPSLLRSRGFLVAVLLVLGAAAIAVLFPNYDGAAFAFELLVWPGSAIGPQLVAGFFAPRASYLLGLIVGALQGVVFTLMLTGVGVLGAQVPADQLANVLFLGFVSGPISGMLFAAAAAWYRRFLAATNPRRPASGQRRTTSNTRRAATRR